MNKHINLIVEGSEGGVQPVEVELISPHVYRIMFSPVFVENVAAGDIVRVTNQNTGEFEVIKYGGNVSVKISDNSPVTEKLSDMDGFMSLVGARLDGNLDHAAVWTIPVKSGFNAIEASVSKVCELLDDPVWWYGNVYDSDNNRINWWL